MLDSSASRRLRLKNVGLVRPLLLFFLLVSGCSNSQEYAASYDGGVSEDDGLPDGGFHADQPDLAYFDAAQPDADLLDAAQSDANHFDGDQPDVDPVDAGDRDVGEPVLDAGAIPPPVPTSLVLTSNYFRADTTTDRGVSAWGTASYPGALPNNSRSTIFWGRFLSGNCVIPGHGATVVHAIQAVGTTFFRAAFPDCMGAYGPSVEADVFADGVYQHFLRTDVSASGAFQDFGSTGQNESGANSYIQAAYVEFNPDWYSNMPHRMRPWSGPSTDPSLARFALRTQQSVVTDVLENPGTQQLQQVLRMLVINEECDPAASSSFCQIELNFKTYNRGVGAYSNFGAGDVFNDAGQGGLIAVVGPLNTAGQSTQILGASAWTSWANATQLGPFTDKLFQVEMSWSQFQQLLQNVTAGNPANVFGNQWQNRGAWVLLRIGYGQENYNRSSTAASRIEGLFEFIELQAL